MRARNQRIKAKMAAAAAAAGNAIPPHTANNTYTDQGGDVSMLSAHPKRHVPSANSANIDPGRVPVPVYARAQVNPLPATNKSDTDQGRIPVPVDACSQVNLFTTGGRIPVPVDARRQVSPVATGAYTVQRPILDLFKPSDEVCPLPAANNTSADQGRIPVPVDARHLVHPFPTTNSAYTAQHWIPDSVNAGEQYPLPTTVNDYTDDEMEFVSNNVRRRARATAPEPEDKNDSNTAPGKKEAVGVVDDKKAESEDDEDDDADPNNNADPGPDKKGKKPTPRKGKQPRSQFRLDPFQSNEVSRDYYFTPEKWKGMALAPVDEAVARMRAECGDNKRLIQETTKYLEGFYDGISKSEKPVYSNNTRVRVLKEKLEGSLRAHINGEGLTYVPTKPELLAARYCHPKGELNATIATLLVQLGLSHLAYVRSYEESTGQDAHHRRWREIRDKMSNDLVTMAEWFEKRVRKLDKARKEVSKHKGGASHEDLAEAMRQTQDHINDARAVGKTDAEAMVTTMVKGKTARIISHLNQVGKDNNAAVKAEITALKNHNDGTLKAEVAALKNHNDDTLKAEIAVFKNQIQDLSRQLAGLTFSVLPTGNVSATSATVQQTGPRPTTPDNANRSHGKRTWDDYDRYEEDRGPKRIACAIEPHMDGAKYVRMGTRPPSRPYFSPIQPFSNNVPREDGTR